MICGLVFEDREKSHASSAEDNGDEFAQNTVFGRSRWHGFCIGNLLSELELCFALLQIGSGRLLRAFAIKCCTTRASNGDTLLVQDQIFSQDE
ncbi:hypothetical protein V6N11_047758 [Hibiscus sabdariffa]|uniref:Uncharacterized protein n=1 Tax=Hibiscus sabdariffa TaxID=183260 RepID=A0ABR2P7X3_9ROSI